MKRKKYKDINYLNFNTKDKPKLEDYNITQEMLDNEISKFDKKKEILKKRKTKYENAKTWLWWLIPTIGFTIYYLADTEYDWFACMLIGSISGISGIVVLCFIMSIISTRIESMEEISLDGKGVLDRYKRYRYDLSCYEIELSRRIKMREEEYWTKMEGHKFENEIAKLYNLHGYSVRVTKGSGDGGVDIIMNKDEQTYYVQCKNHSKPVSPATARELFGVMTHAGVQHGIIVSPRGFTFNVRKFISGKNIELIEIDDILRMANNLND
ncbi:MAG: restriction endonuclease [Eubacteriales bacterium]